MLSTSAVLIGPRIHNSSTLPSLMIFSLTWKRLWQFLLLFWMCSTVVDCADGLNAVSDAITGDHSYHNNTHNNFDIHDNYDNFNQLSASNETRVLRRGKRYLEFSKGSRMSVGFVQHLKGCLIFNLSPSICSGVPMAKTISLKSTHFSPMVMVFEPIIRFPIPRINASEIVSSLSVIYFQNWKPP